MEPSTEELRAVKTRQQLLLDQARSSASFEVAKLTSVIFGSAALAEEHAAQRRRAEIALGESDPKALPRVYRGLSRRDLYAEGLRWGKQQALDNAKHGVRHFKGYTYKYGLVSVSPYGHQFTLFVPGLKLLADDEQLAHWLPLAENLKIIGTYVQTELGHGTFVRGVETTATYDMANDEFVLHSPTITATKYWPGGLGYTATHAIVMARLVVQGKDYGTQPFLVQLRSLEDHSPLPGLELGDIGTKIGWHGSDNGYARFNHVRIPRRQLLMRNIQLTRDGKVTQSPHAKLNYQAMTSSRVLVVQTSVFQLAQAATIATRYSFIREQGMMGDNPKAGETLVIAYKSQHYRILSILAKVYAILFASKDLDSIYERHEELTSRGDFTQLHYTHIATSFLKAYCTEISATGAEDARRCCGGHGYSLLSGFPAIVGDLVPLVTLEGENYAMYQQAARYLVKAVRAAVDGKMVDEPMKYLLGGHHLHKQAQGSFADPAVQLEAFRHRASRLLFEATSLLHQSEKNGIKPEDAWNTHMMRLLDAARAHAELFTLESFIKHVSRIRDIPLRRVLSQLCSLYALNAIESSNSPGALAFFEDGYITPFQLRDIRELVNSLHTTLLPEAVGLVDAWNFSDASLQSAIGQKDGNAYETLLSWTRQLPMNVENRLAGNIDPGYERYIRPMTKSIERTAFKL